MNIGFDAKRAFHNGTGLGNYSRTLIKALAHHYPSHHYYLFNPKSSSQYTITGDNITEVQPSSFFYKHFSSIWRSSAMIQDWSRYELSLYHGLSHELPMGIEKSSVKTVVTIHDLIHERYPEQYPPLDVRIYQKKFRYACEHADQIIAISEQTKKDIIDFYQIKKEKIEVCYQSCDPIFSVKRTDAEVQAVKEKYQLPKKYFLYVGSIIERKNLLSICRAMSQLKSDLPIPLVVIGDGGKYKQVVKEYIAQHGLEQSVLFLSERCKQGGSMPTLINTDFPSIYQGAVAMIYPSSFEGFGIPVLEAMWSAVPVITANRSCLPEVGGDAVHYVDPDHAEEIATAMRKIANDDEYAEMLSARGLTRAVLFDTISCAHSVMELYKRVVQ